jgi:hypothetical protein
MKNVFIKVVNGNHQECIDYLMSLGGENWNNWKGTARADSYCIGGDGRVGWVDEKGWYAENGYTEIFLPETTASKRHPHYDLLVQWASDMSQKVWRKKENGEWKNIKGGCWMQHGEYYIGETPPPNLEPVLFEDVCKDVDYYIANPVSRALCFAYRNFSCGDEYLFDRKLVFSTPEGAIKRAKEMLGMADDDN